MGENQLVQLAGPQWPMVAQTEQSAAAIRGLPSLQLPWPCQQRGQQVSWQRLIGQPWPHDGRRLPLQTFQTTGEGYRRSAGRIRCWDQRRDRQLPNAKPSSRDARLQAWN